MALGEGAGEEGRQTALPSSPGPDSSSLCLGLSDFFFFFCLGSFNLPQAELWAIDSLGWEEGQQSKFQPSGICQPCNSGLTLSLH